jgi:glutathione peroxidase-family protein
MKTKSLLSVLTLLLALGPGVAQAQESGYKVGDYANDFRLRNVNNELVSLADYKAAKGFVVVFTCNHCPFAKLYDDRLVALHHKYASKGYLVLAINPNDTAQQAQDSFDKMQAKASEKHYPFAYLRDETQQVAGSFGATRTPQVFLLAKEGDRLRVAYIGAVDNSPEDATKVTERYVEKALDELLSGRKVSRDNTKAVGCTIKWKE